MTGLTVVGGRYELAGTLGRGGMAEVRRAVDTRLGRAVAVKLLRADLATDPTFQARFRREAQSAAGLNHPSIVAVYDTGEEQDPTTGIAIPYIVMELLEGKTLRDVLREGRILPERALEFTSGVLDALSYSHQAGIVHRDIKPANVMLTPTGAIKVMDFGIARAVADTSATMTQTAAVIGTAQYLSPEQARGENVDARSDIYSAGCLLYELLVGRPPFVGDSSVSVAYQHVRELPLPPSRLDPAISPDIDAITLRSLAKDPDERYPSARAMKDDITRVLTGQGVTAVVGRVDPEAATSTRLAPIPVVAPPTPDEEEPRRSRAGLVAAVSLLILALLGGGGYAFSRYLQPGGVAAAQTVTVPAVLGTSRAEADSTLRNARLVPQFKNVNGADDQTKQTATKQDPRGGSTVPVNSTVLVEINVGPRTATIPGGLIGGSKNDVKQTLTDAGFTVRLVKADTEPVTADKGEVLGVTPDEGEIAAVGQEVTVSYATGESAVPVLTGRVRDQAESDAKAAGFRVHFKKKFSDQPAGIVIDQDPKPGVLTERGTRITLTVAKSRPAPDASTAPPPSSSSSSKPPSPSSTPSKPSKAPATPTSTPTMTPSATPSEQESSPSSPTASPSPSESNGG